MRTTISTPPAVLLPRSPAGRRIRSTTSGCCAVAALLALLLAADSSSAQPVTSIAIDGLLDGVTAEALVGPDYEIPASKGVQTGGNLFFSYSRFGLETGESATFTGPASVTRILNRVTGSEVSAINGLIRSEIAGASVYLVNPNGIVMGEDASLDLSGAFHATTADLLEFEDGGEFHASFPERDTPLSMSPVSAFGFLSNDPAGIRIQGSRLISGSISLIPQGANVAVGQPISLIGGEIEILGGSDPTRPAYLYTGGERLDIASLDSPGRVRITNVDPGDPQSSDGLVVTQQGGAPLRFDDVRIGAASLVVTGGPPPETDLADTFANGSGDVRIRAHDLTLDDAVIRTVTTTGKPGGTVDAQLTGDFLADGRGLDRTTGIVAGSGLVIERQDRSVPVAFSQTVVNFFPEGPARIATRFDAQGDPIRIEHIAAGPGGEITVGAENVSILGGAKLSSSGVFGGDGGTITLTAQDTVTLAGARQDGEVGGLFANALEGASSGSIVVDARRLVLDDLAGIFGEVSGGAGDGGTIDIDVDQLLIEGSGRIDTTTRGDGSGGLITIDASEWLRLAGRTDDIRFSSITTFSLDAATGRAGTIEIRTPEIQLSDGAGISTAASGLGDGGIIDLRANIIDLSASQITSSAEFGTAGDIYINGGPLAPNSLEIVKPDDVLPGERLFLDRSTISTNANDGSGRGGDIVIDPEFVVLRESAITAQAVQGQGGNIVIIADQLISDLDSLINADSEFSTNGIVEIRGSGQALRGDLATLPSTIPDVVQLLRERCAARRSGAAAASFVLRGRDGLPHSPEDYLPAYHEIAPAPSEEIAVLPVADPNGPVELVLGCRGAAG